MKPNSTLILFDWDRTLSDVEGPTNNLLRQTFAQHGNNQFEEFISIFRSPKNQGRKIIDRLQEILWEKLGTIYYNTFSQIKRVTCSKPRLFNGIMTQLREIKMRQECILGIVTNKNEEDVMEEEFGRIAELFQFIIGGKDVLPQELKPSGYLINKAIWRANIWVQRILMIWDTCHDINALWNADFDGEKIWVLSTWGLRQEEAEIQREGINDTKIDSILEIPSVSLIGNTIKQLLERDTIKWRPYQQAHSSWNLLT